MNANVATLNRSDDELDTFAAELTDAAFPIALRHGIADNWLELKLDLWRALNNAVKESTVIVTNPTHVAVALRYHPAEGAPIVMARGYDEVAQHIKKIAKELGIPMVENVPLARGLAERAKVGRVIPADFYAAVAEVWIRARRVVRWLRRLPRLPLPTPMQGLAGGVLGAVAVTAPASAEPAPAAVAASTLDGAAPVIAWA